MNGCYQGRMYPRTRRDPLRLSGCSRRPFRILRGPDRTPTGLLEPETYSFYFNIFGITTCGFKSGTPYETRHNDWGERGGGLITPPPTPLVYDLGKIKLESCLI